MGTGTFRNLSGAETQQWTMEQHWEGLDAYSRVGCRTSVVCLIRRTWVTTVSSNLKSHFWVISTGCRFGKMCRGEFASPQAQDFLGIRCLPRSTYRKRSKSAPDATLVEEVDHGGRFGGIYDPPTWGWELGVWRACFSHCVGRECQFIILQKDYVSSWVSRVSVRCQIDFGFILYEPECFYGWSWYFLRSDSGPLHVTGGHRRETPRPSWNMLNLSQDFGWFVSKMAPNNP